MFTRSGMTRHDIKRARQVARLFYTSNIWKKSENTGEPVTLRGYLAVIKKVAGEDAAQLKNAFEVAHFLKYVTIYKAPGAPGDELLYIKKGPAIKRF